ncbi:ferritin-like domain-containing protein [Fulvivirga sediminis]|uniref:PA2169 family four-helix-bundle protein n=1 Tax=Fulvivirga sediminis TaxID=2803949 RepID=A0A937F7E6_9BACT|nr:PA2169 family four-helix-bundle protein [Fulvivirga sediminis]MBL3655468.1 PA2169 family four-helix-bundle protein [Fulvivirga sediminis]
MNTEKKAIQDVVDICHDGMKGYEKAASEIHNEEFKTIFNRLAQQRKLFIEELKADVRDQGIDIDDSGTVKGYFHRNWLDVKSSFTNKEDKEIIEEAKFGEKEAVKVYNEALNADVPKYIKEKLEMQRKLIAGSIEQLNEFAKETV